MAPGSKAEASWSRSHVGDEHVDVGGEAVGRPLVVEVAGGAPLEDPHVGEADGAEPGDQPDGGGVGGHRGLDGAEMPLAQRLFELGGGVGDHAGVDGLRHPAERPALLGEPDEFGQRVDDRRGSGDAPGRPNAASRASAATGLTAAFTGSSVRRVRRGARAPGVRCRR